jgi:GT2 family glycosyltransferase
VTDSVVTEIQTDLSQKATVVIVPRERLTPAPKTVAAVIASIPSSVPLIVVDGAYPPQVREGIGNLSKERPFTSLRFDHYLLPAEARNRALDIVETPYVVFVDNDIEVETGWLENLVATAEREKAAIVTPLTTIRVDRGEGPKEYVHHAGGKIRYVKYKRQLTYASERRHEWTTPDDPVLDTLPPSSDDVELHTFLADAAALRSVGGFDERLVICDHDDLALRLHMTGARLAFCRKSKACYDATGGIDPEDKAFFAFRWSRQRVALSCEVFKRNWIAGQLYSWEWAVGHRRRMLAPFAPAWANSLSPSLFDVYVAGLRLKNGRSPAERTRKDLGAPRICPDVPREIAQFYKKTLRSRPAGSEFPALPAFLSANAQTILR